jgi:hypothetical protein
MLTGRFFRLDAWEGGLFLMTEGPGVSGDGVAARHALNLPALATDYG